jgi:hypothetical protein
MRSDTEIATEIRQTIGHLAALMNEAKDHNIVVNFNVAETDVIENGQAVRKEFREIVIIQKIESL